MSTPPFLELPAGVEPRQLATRRGELAALFAPARGQAASPVLLVPGITGSKEDFIAVLALLANAGHAVTAIDQRGQFESRGDDDGSGYDVAELGLDLVDLAGALAGPGPVHLVGHSFGGLVARAAVLAEPTAFRSLALLDSGPAAVPPPSTENLTLLVQALAVMELDQIWVAKRALETPNEPTPPPPEVEAWMRRRFLANHPVSLRRIAQQLLAEPDRTEELAKTLRANDVPALVAYGQTDDAWPPAVQAEMAERLGAAHVEIAGAGHSPAATHPEVTAQVLTHFFASAERAG